MRTTSIICQSLTRLISLFFKSRSRAIGRLLKIFILKKVECLPLWQACNLFVLSNFVEFFYKSFFKKVHKHIVKVINMCYNQKKHEGVVL